MISSSAIAAWLATYAVHSTILLLLAAIASRLAASHAAKEAIWKSAIVAGLITSSLQSFTNVKPLAGRWAVNERTSTVESAATSTTGSNTPSSEQPSASSEQGDKGAQVTDDASQPAIRQRFDLISAILGVWLVISLLLIARLIIHHRRLLAALRDRRTVADGKLPGMLAELRRRAAVWTPVRLSSSPACPTPIAIGRAEICIPDRFETDLEIDQQRSALAHELAHLKRRDPVWQMSVGIIESIFFFQPLNVLGRMRMREAAEYLCDDWAVEQTRTPMALARCLTQISSWVGSAPVPDGMLAMAEGGSPLVQRIQRLSEWHATQSRGARVALVSAVVIAAIVTTSAPAFSARDHVSASLVSAIPSTDPQSASPDPVIAYAGSASLEEKWNWARATAPKTPYWIGWEIEGVDSRGPITSSTRNVPSPDATAPALSTLVRSRPSAGTSAAILIGFDGSNVVSMRFQRTGDRVYLGGRPLIWLGRAETRESLSRLGTLLNTQTAAAIRKELAAAHGIHAARELAIPALRSIIRSDRDAATRREAIQWLARLHGTDARAIDVLVDATMRDSDEGVRIEAVDGLRTAMRSGSSEARASLMRIADSGADMRVRSEAMQALTRR